MRFRLPGALAVALTLAACGGIGNSLSGSIGESYSLSFDYAQIRKQDQVLIIEYLRNQAGGVIKVCKIVVDTDGLGLDPGAILKCQGHDCTLFLARVQVSRVASTGGDFPPLQSGQIQFQDFNFVDKGKVSGELDVLFTNGRTLHANFENHVELVPTG
jgi:hypothetical protein